MSFERTKQREKEVLISSSLPFSLRLPRGNKIAAEKWLTPFVLAMIERSISLSFFAVVGCVQKNFFVAVVAVAVVVVVGFAFSRWENWRRNN